MATGKIENVQISPLIAGGNILTALTLSEAVAQKRTIELDDAFLRA